MNRLTKFFAKPWLAVLLFYGWNILGIIMLIALEINSHVFAELFHEVFFGYTPALYLIQVVLIFAIPLFCFIVGIIRIGKDYGRLLRWFYGVEVPLLVLGIIRIVALNDFATHTLWFFLYLLSAVLVYGFYLLFPDRFTGRFEAFFRMVFFLIGLHIVAFLLLYVVPLTWLALKSLGYINLLSYDDIAELFKMGGLLLIMVLFGSLTGTLFILSPIAFAGIWIFENGTKLIRLVKEKRALAVFGLAALVFAVFIEWPATQPQIHAFKTNTAFKESGKNTDILENENEIKKGLLNAYLNKYRYFSRQGKNNIRNIYEEAFATDGQTISEIHNFLLDPFLYQGHYEDADSASVIYQELFDSPIERAESESILFTLGSAFSPSDGEATLLSIDQKEVLVSDRDFDYKELGDGWVQVDFHERYLNKTFRNQEIFYYFSMPESGVLTDMWLGNSDSLPKEFEAIIAPRGAAQQVYLEERRARRDPSLLEQVGPNQYRLRVFPIPALQSEWVDGRKKITKEQLPVHLTLRFVLKTDSKGHLNFPILNEKRKVYWKDNEDAGTKVGQWFPDESPDFTPYILQSIYFDSWHAEPIALQNLPELKKQEKLVLCFDASYSMNKEMDQLNQALEAYPYKENTPIYAYTSFGLEKSDWTPKKPQFLGAIDPYQAIQDVHQKHPNAHILFLCDQGSYELLPEVARPAQVTQMPVDIIHLGKMAPIYEDALNDLVMQSGGDCYVSMEEWIAWESRLPTNEYGKRDGTIYWDLHRFLDDTLNPNSAVIAPAASKLVQSASRKASQEPAHLDLLHKLATRYRFVSPFSSMICLVNNAQEEKLKQLSEGNDRYQREVETGKDSGNSFDFMGAKGVPEPEEWLMIILGAGAIGFLYWRERKKKRFDFG